MSLKKISDKILSKQIKIRYSVENTFLNNDSPVFCDECNKRLGLITMVHFALGKKKGEIYLVVCKHCNYLNKRIKGEMSKKIDSDWDKYGF